MDIIGWVYSMAVAILLAIPFLNSWMGSPRRRVLVLLTCTALFFLAWLMAGDVGWAADQFRRDMLAGVLFYVCMAFAFLLGPRAMILGQDRVQGRDFSLLICALGIYHIVWSYSGSGRIDADTVAAGVLAGAVLGLNIRGLTKRRQVERTRIDQVRAGSEGN